MEKAGTSPSPTHPSQKTTMVPKGRKGDGLNDQDQKDTIQETEESQDDGVFY